MDIKISPVVFVGVGIAIVLWIFLPVGIYLGGDWTVPATPYQSKKLFHPYLWNSAVNFGQPSLITPLVLPFSLLIYFTVSLGLPVEYLGKIILTVCFLTAYFFQCDLLRYFKFGNFASIVGGIIYITTPIFFNYSLMGWYFALFAMALFPLATKWLCKAVQQDDAFYTIGVAFLWALATLQSQSIVWFPLIFIAIGIYLVCDGESVKVYLKKIGLIFLTYVLLCSYWWIALIVFQDINVTDNSIVKSSVSLGSSAHYNAVTAFRLWGSLFNFQYETSLLNGWTFGAWLLPITSIIAIIYSERRLAIAIGFLAFVVPIVIFFLQNNVDILIAIPGSALIRHLSRFTTLTSFAYALLIGIFFDSIAKIKDSQKRKFSLFTITVVLILSVWPWWTGEFENIQNRPIGKDFRFRTQEFPRDYYEVEKFFRKIDWASRVLYLPYGLGLSYKYNHKFQGAYHESIDIFGVFSPIPGAFMPTDRPSAIADYLLFLGKTDDIIKSTFLTPTNFYVLRKDIDAGPVEEIIKRKNLYFPRHLFDLIWESKNILIYQRKNLLPLVYSPSKVRLQNGTVNAFDDVSISVLADQEPALIFVSQDFKKVLDNWDAVTRLAATPEVQRMVEFRKINPTKLRVRLHHVRDDVPLFFGESYSTGWKLYSIPYQASEKATSIAKVNEISLKNQLFQADSAEIKKFTDQGWISSIGKEFISKSFFGTVQNNNLAEGSLMDAWFSIPLPEERHIKVNGYANGWLIDTEELCADSEICKKNKDGSFDIELVMEFWPQQIFYIGLVITGVTLFLLIFFLLRPSKTKGEKTFAIL